MVIDKFRRNVSGNLAAATDDHPVIIERYTSQPYRMVLTYEQGVRALEALREKEASDQHKQEEAA